MTHMLLSGTAVIPAAAARVNVRRLPLRTTRSSEITEIVIVTVTGARFCELHADSRQYPMAQPL